MSEFVLTISIFLLCIHLHQTCYGSEDEATQEKVRQLYRDLKLPELYEEQEEASYKRVVDMIAKHAEELPFQVFNTILNKIHKRDH